MKKKLIALIVVALAGASIATAGCSSSKTATQEQSSEGDKTATTVAAKGTEESKATSIADLIAKGKEVKGMSYDYTVTAQGMPTPVTGKMWMQGKKFKVETSVMGQNSILIFDSEANTGYMYNPATNTAVKIASMTDAKAPDSPGDYLDKLSADSKIVGHETINGMACTVIEVTDKSVKDVVQSKIWISEDYGIPVRVESTTTDGKTVIDFKNFKVGDIADDTFELPAGVKVTDLSSLTKNAPKVPNVPGMSNIPGVPKQ